MTATAQTQRLKNPNAKKSSLRANTISPTANGILHTIFIIYALLCVVPMLLVIGVSFTQEDQIMKVGYKIIPSVFSLKAYEYLFKLGLVGQAYLNTIIATVAGTVLCVTMVTLYAYPLSRKDFRLMRPFTFYLFFTMLFGGGMAPYYIVCSRVLGLYDNIYALFVPLSFSGFWVIVMRSFFKTQIPDGIIESARIDGAGEWRTLLQIVLPLALPGLATVCLFSVIGIWNNFFTCMLLTKSDQYTNLQYMIYRALSSLRFLKDAATSMGANAATSDVNNAIANMPNESFRMAMCVVTVGPIIFTYPFFQKYFIKGLTIGALKG